MFKRWHTIREDEVLTLTGGKLFHEIITLGTKDDCI